MIALPDSTNALVLKLNSVPGGIASYLTLHIGSDAFPLSDASVDSDGRQFDWSGHGLSWAENDTIAVRLTSSIPTVSSVEITSDPNNATYGYGIGDEIEATVTFDAAVDITGTPQLELDFAGTAKAAACTAATNTTTMACYYTVVVNDTAPNGIAIAENKLTGGTITATGSTTVNAVLAHAAVAIDAGQKVDGIRPTLVTTGSEAPTTSTDGTQVILTFSETISAADLAKINISAGNIPQATTARSVTGTTVEIDLTTALTTTSTTITVELAVNAVEDGASNGNLAVPATAVINAVVDPPAVTSVEITSLSVNDFSGIGSLIEATVTFDAAVDITGTPQLELDFAGTAKAANCTAATNTTTMVCNYTVVVNDTAPDGIAIAANKLTLNGGTITATGSTTLDADLDHSAVAIDAGQKVDGIRPTLVTTGADAPTTSTDGTQVILTFSEDLSTADRTKITIGIGGGNVAQTSAARVAGTTVELDLSTIIDATVMLTVALDAAAVEDGASNGNLAVAATAVINAIGSTTAPTVTAVELISTPNDNVYAIDDTVVVAVRFSAAVDITGTPQLDFAGTPKPADCLPDTNTTGMACNYTVAVNDSAPNGIAIAANTLTLNGGTIRATGSTTIDADLDHGAVAIDANHKVDGIRPTLVTTGSNAPTTSTDGTKIILFFNEFIGTVDRTKITVKSGTTTQATPLGSVLSGPRLEIALATALTSADTAVTVELGADAVTDGASNGNLAVAATAVTNAVDAGPPGTLKARRGDGEVHLEWVPVAAVPTDPDRAYQLRYGAAGGESNQWRDIPRSAPGGRNARSYTVTGLENGTRYVFELRVRRASGFGTATEIRQTPEAARWSVSTNRRSVHEGEDVTLSIATRNAVGFYSAPEALTLAVIGEIVLEFATIDGADPEDFEIRVDGTTVQGYTKDITLLNFDKDLDRDPFPAQHFDVEVPVGSTSLDVTVTVLADEEEDGQEHMSFMVFRGEELVNEDTWDGTGVNIESRDAGVVKQLAVADAEATEGEDPSLDFVVTLAPAAAWTVTVDYATRDGTARAGADYTDTSGALTFAPGETAKTVSVPVIDDTVEDTPETLTVKLSNANPPYNEEEGAWEWGSQEAGVLIADAVATGTIRNTEDQAEPPAVSVSDASAAEGDSVVFTVSLSATSSQQVTVDYATADGTATAGEDYTATSGTLTFQAGETTKTISVPITDDTEDAGGETFTLTLSNASGADLGDAEATGTIRDTDTTATPLTASFKNLPATHDGSSEVTFQVEFSEDVGISYAVLRDDGFAVTQGEVTGARRVNGRNDLWQITVEPDGRDDVTITLPGHRNCGTTGAVCTRGDDPRPLSHSPSATVAGPEEDPAVTNTAATGTPTISGTPQVDETLTASVSDVSNADGLDDARYAYQWIRGSADIERATGSSYTLVSADEGETIKVQVGFTDDAGHAESLTSAATDAVAPAPEPLTATFSGVPAEHDGSEFTFALTFSEDVAGLSYLTLRDVALSATGGTVQRARRQQQGRNQGWTIHVEPDSHAAVTVRLPAGSVESSDGRALAQSLSATVAGPVGISVADARVEEAEGAQLAFVVTLSRAASGALTVDYATSDGSAHAGDDYRATSGTLTVGAGERSTTIEVAVLDDAHDEGEETLTLRLSNPSSGRLADRDGDRHDREPRSDATGALGAVRPDGGGARGRARGRAAPGAARAGVPGPVRGPGAAAGDGARHRAQRPAPARRDGRCRSDGRGRAGRPGRWRRTLADGPRRRGRADRLGRRAGSRDGPWRHSLVLEPRGAVALRRPRGRAVAGRRRAHDDVRGRLREGAGRDGPVAVAQPGPGRVRRGRRRPGGLVGDGPVPVAGLQGDRPHHGLGRGRVRRRRAAADARRRAGPGERAVDGDGGGRDTGRAVRRRGGRFRAGVQGRCPLGRHVDRRRGRRGGASGGDRGGGDPVPDGAGGLAGLHARRPAVAEAERRGRAAARRRGRRDRRRHGRGRRAGGVG